MSVPADLTYPTNAKKTTWDKAKSRLDKMSSATKKTGLGEALKAAEEAWADIPFGSMVASPVKIQSTAAAQTARGVADAAIKKEVKAAYVAIVKARKAANDQSTNAKLSSTSRDAAKAAKVA